MSSNAPSDIRERPRAGIGDDQGCWPRSGRAGQRRGDLSRRGWLLFAAMSVIWGIPYLLIKVADGGVAPPVLVLARVTIGAALLLPIAIRRRELAPLLPHWRWLVLFAFVEIIAPWLLLSEAETRLSSSLSGLLIASVPILVAVFSWLTGSQDRLTAVRWSGLDR